jgi:hypothetical protein
MEGGWMRDKISKNILVFNWCLIGVKQACYALCLQATAKCHFA